MERPVSWWQKQVARVQVAPCPKCQRQTQAEYVVDTSGDSRYKRTCRAVIEHCRNCGWCHAWVTQEQGGPIEMNTTSRSIRPVGVNTLDLTDDEADEVGKRASVVRLPGQPLKKRSVIDRERYQRKKDKLLRQKRRVT